MRPGPRANAAEPGREPASVEASLSNSSRRCSWIRDSSTGNGRPSLHEAVDSAGLGPGKTGVPGRLWSTQEGGTGIGSGTASAPSRAALRGINIGTRGGSGVSCSASAIGSGMESLSRGRSDEPPGGGFIDDTAQSRGSSGGSQDSADTRPDSLRTAPPLEGRFRSPCLRSRASYFAGLRLRDRRDALSLGRGTSGSCRLRCAASAAGRGGREPGLD